MNAADVFIERAKKYNCYLETLDHTQGRKCVRCMRWRLSFPYTCNDYDIYSTKAETCLNWTDNHHPVVD